MENLVITVFVEKVQRILKIESDFRQLFSILRYGPLKIPYFFVLFVHNSGTEILLQNKHNNALLLYF